MDRSVRYAGAATALAAALLAGGCSGGMGGEGQKPDQGQEQGQPPQAPPPAPPPNSDQGQGGDQAALDAAAKAEMEGKMAQLLQQSPITFEPDSATMTQQGEQTVQQIGSMITESPGELRFEVGGFTAPGQGGSADAATLAQERAQAVADKLTAAGVPAERLEAKGVGESEPMGDPTQERRVEITIL